MNEYQGHFVSLLWQSKHARAASALTSGELHFGSAVTGGFSWIRPYGTSWMATRKIAAPTALRTCHFLSFIVSRHEHLHESERTQSRETLSAHFSMPFGTDRRSAFHATLGRTFWL
jgi:hypothetical protein